MNIRDEINELSEKLATERDELRLQSHLLGTEMRDEWKKVEVVWGHFQGKVRHVKLAGQKTGEEVLSATKELGHDLTKAYKRFRDAL